MIGQNYSEAGIRRENMDSAMQSVITCIRRGEMHCTPEQILIGAGSDYILMLLSIILGKNHRIAFEDPTYKQAYHVLSGLGYETVPVPVDKNGLRVDALKMKNADIAYVTPSHQYPTGIVMPLKRRLELLRWANEKEGRFILKMIMTVSSGIKGNRFRHYRDMILPMRKLFIWEHFQSRSHRRCD